VLAACRARAAKVQAAVVLPRKVMNSLRRIDTPRLEGLSYHIALGLGYAVRYGRP